MFIKSICYKIIKNISIRIEYDVNIGSDKYIKYYQMNVY